MRKLTNGEKKTLLSPRYTICYLPRGATREIFTEVTRFLSDDDKEENERYLGKCAVRDMLQWLIEDILRK